MESNVDNIDKNGNITLTQRQMWYSLIGFLLMIIPTAITSYNHINMTTERLDRLEKRMDKWEESDEKFKENFLKTYTDFEKVQIENITKIKTKLGL